MRKNEVAGFSTFDRDDENKCNWWLFKIIITSVVVGFLLVYLFIFCILYLCRETVWTQQLLFFSNLWMKSEEIRCWIQHRGQLLYAAVHGPERKRRSSSCLSCFIFIWIRLTLPPLKRKKPLCFLFLLNYNAENASNTLKPTIDSEK